MAKLLMSPNCLNSFLLLETNSAKQSQALLNTKLSRRYSSEYNTSQFFELHKKYYKNIDLKDLSEESIIAELYSQGVICCKRIKISRNAETIQTNTYLLTFNRLQLPSVISMGYLRVRVEKYIPSPLRCTKCQKFGHRFSKCRNHTAICCRCSIPLPSPKVPGMPTKCNNCERNHPIPKCVHCEEDHSASSKECSKYK